MKVCCINPNSPFLAHEDVSPPMGLFYLSAALKQAGHKVVYVDLGLGDLIPDTCDVYAVTGTTSQWETIRQIPKWLEGKRCIAGGVHATVLPEEVMAAGYQSVCMGDGEEAIVDMLTENSPSYLAPGRGNLDMYPFPDRTYARRYRWELDGREATTLITARGCPYHCAFCGESYDLNQYRVRSADNVIMEIENLAQYWNYNAVHVYDDTFISNGKRLKKICDAFKDNGIIWRCFMRGNQAKPELLEMMRDGGCVEVAVGIESGSQTILDNINKGETIEEIRNGIVMAKEAGLRVKGYIIVGLPGDTHETLQETERFLDSVRLDDIGVTILSVMPGTPIYNNPEKYDVKFDTVGHWITGRRGEYEATVETPGLTKEEIVQWRDHLEEKANKVWR